MSNAGIFARLAAFGAMAMSAAGLPRASIHSLAWSGYGPSLIGTKGAGISMAQQKRAAIKAKNRARNKRK